MLFNILMDHLANPANSENSVCIGRRALAASVSCDDLAGLQVSQKLPATSVCLNRTLRTAFPVLLARFLSAHSIKKTWLFI